MVVSRHKLLSLLCLLVFTQACHTQKNFSTPSDVGSEYILEGKFKLVEVDKFERLYLVTDDNEILQLVDNKITFRYSDRSIGAITKIDVRNPQKIMVYYGEYFQILFLDNTLSEAGRIDLDGLGYWDIQDAAVSRDNFIWLYDPVNYRLFKINDQGQEQLGSNELFDLPEGFNPVIRVSEDKVLLCSDGLIKQYGEFGGWEKDMPLQYIIAKTFGDDFIYLQNNRLFQYDLLPTIDDPSQQIANCNKGTIDFAVEDNTIYFIDRIGLMEIITPR